MKQIKSFWNFFQKNEQEIINAFFLGINSDEVYSQFIKNFNKISTRIGFEIMKPCDDNQKIRILFTAYGYRKLFPKVIALENQAPNLKHFIVQGLIKPFGEMEKYKNGTDEIIAHPNYNLKISDIQMSLLDYNIETKQLKINIYLTDYDNIYQFDDLESNIEWILMQIIGEIAFGKHIKKIKLNQLPLNTNGLLNIVELPYFIDYLYKINSRKKPRIN